MFDINFISMKKIILTFCLASISLIGFSSISSSLSTVGSKINKPLSVRNQWIISHFHDCDHSFCQSHPYDGLGSYTCSSCSMCR